MTSNNKTNRTVEKNMDRIMELLSKIRFYGMLETYRNDCRTTSSDGMTNDEFLKWLLESEYDYRRNVSIERLIRSANFRYKAYMEKIDYTIRSEHFSIFFISASIVPLFLASLSCPISFDALEYKVLTPFLHASYPIAEAI